MSVNCRSRSDGGGLMGTTGDRDIPMGAPDTTPRNRPQTIEARGQLWTQSRWSDRRMLAARAEGCKFAMAGFSSNVYFTADVSSVFSLSDECARSEL
jgi:hypothetical protein